MGDHWPRNRRIASLESSGSGMGGGWTALEHSPRSAEPVGSRGMRAGGSWSKPVPFWLAIHPALPPPEIAGGQEVCERHGFWDGHHLPRRVVDQLREAHDQPLL